MTYIDISKSSITVSDISTGNIETIPFVEGQLVAVHNGAITAVNVNVNSAMTLTDDITYKVFAQFRTFIDGEFISDEVSELNLHSLGEDEIIYSIDTIHVPLNINNVVVLVRFYVEEYDTNVLEALGNVGWMNFANNASNPNSLLQIARSGIQAGVKYLTKVGTSAASKVKTTVGSGIKKVTNVVKPKVTKTPSGSTTKTPTTKTTSGTTTSKTQRTPQHIYEQKTKLEAQRAAARSKANAKKNTTKTESGTGTTKTGTNTTKTKVDKTAVDKTNKVTIKSNEAVASSLRTKLAGASKALLSPSGLLNAGILGVMLYEPVAAMITDNTNKTPELRDPDGLLEDPEYNDGYGAWCSADGIVCYDEETGKYYNPESGLIYDPLTGLWFDPDTGNWYESLGDYPDNPIIDPEPEPIPEPYPCPGCGDGDGDGGGDGGNGGDGGYTCEDLGYDATAADGVTCLWYDAETGEYFDDNGDIYDSSGNRLTDPIPDDMYPSAEQTDISDLIEDEETGLYRDKEGNWYDPYGFKLISFNIFKEMYDVPIAVDVSLLSYESESKLYYDDYENIYDANGYLIDVMYPDEPIRLPINILYYEGNVGFYYDLNVNWFDELGLFISPSELNADTSVFGIPFEYLAVGAVALTGVVLLTRQPTSKSSKSKSTSETKPKSEPRPEPKPKSKTHTSDEN